MGKYFDYEKVKQQVKYAVLPDGAKIAYDEWGSGDKYILCAQQGHDNYSYSRRFANYGYHVIRIWNRGCGMSEPVHEDIGADFYNLWADDVVRVADCLGIDKFVYTGHSHGGGVGWHVVWRHPERVIAFIALNSGPHPLDGNPSSLRKMVQENPGIDFANYPTDDPGALAYRATFRDFAEACKKYSLELPFNYGKPMAALGTEENLIEVLKTITLPVLLISGIDDLLAPPKYALRTACALPNCKLVLYSHASHGFNSLEAWQETMNEAIPFLKNVEENNGRPYAKIVFEE